MFLHSCCPCPPRDDASCRFGRISFGIVQVGNVNIFYDRNKCLIWWSVYFGLFESFFLVLSTFNYIKRISSSLNFGLRASICNRHLNLQTSKTKFVRISHDISCALNVRTGTPQGCMLSPLVYSLYDCVAKYPNLILNLLLVLYYCCWPDQQQRWNQVQEWDSKHLSHDIKVTN